MAMLIPETRQNAGISDDQSLDIAIPNAVFSDDQVLYFL